VSVAAVVILAVVTMTPAAGGAADLAKRLAAATGLIPTASQSGKAFSGTPAVGALFTTSGGALGSHFCTASVVDSPTRDLVITAAHCVTGRGSMAFVPGYDNGRSPYGIWIVTQVIADQAWTSSSDPDHDVAFLVVSWAGQARAPGGGTRIEDLTGAELLGVGRPRTGLVRVIGYPDSQGQPIACQNRTRAWLAHQLEFDCDGYTGGTSGGPFLADVDEVTGQGTVIGVIGGYEQGGFVAAISYSAAFGPSVRALYATAVTRG
jgi:V8-like Glu-specific endopeptidase